MVKVDFELNFFYTNFGISDTFIFCKLAGDIIGSGISKAADVTGDIVETFGEKEKPNEKITAATKDLNELLKNAKVEENDAEWLP